MTAPDITETARHQVQLAIAAIRSRHPLLGMALALLAVVFDLAMPAVATAVCVVSQGRITLRLHAAWVDAAPLEELEGILMHEVIHLLLGHHSMDRAGLNGDLLDIAQDLCVNEYLDRPAPAGTATLRDFPGFPPHESVRERYRRLELLWAAMPPDAAAPPPQPPPAPAAGAAPGSPGDTTPGTDEAADPADGSADDAVADADDGSAAAAAGGSSSGQPTPPASPSAAAGQAPGNHRLLVAMTLQAAADLITDPATLSPAEQSLLSEQAQIVVGRGAATGGTEEVLVASTRTQPLAPWKRLLRRWVGSALSTAHVSYARPSRRQPELIGIVPGRQSLPGKPVIQVVIDTSGSMSVAMLAEIARELRFLARRRRVVIVECDAEIQRIYRFTGRIDRCHGRGGTDFCPPFEPAVLRRTQAEAIVFFTDGDGPAPDQPPKQPVLWVLTTDAPAPAPWGALTRLTVPDRLLPSTLVNT